MENKYGSENVLIKSDVVNSFAKQKDSEIRSSSEYTSDTYTVTNILPSVEVAHTGVPTRTTPTLTPTTLKNIEQLLELPSSVSPPESHSNQAGFVPPPVFSTASSTFVDAKSWGGGITTISSIPENYSSSNSYLREARMPALLNSTEKVSTKRVGGRRPTTNEKLSPEEDLRRRQRRERNKEAAARCRKRRLDQTNRLQDETEDLETKKEMLKEEIQNLEQQKLELEYLLSSHKPNCKKNSVIPMEIEIKKEVEVDDHTEEKKLYFPTRPTSLPLTRGISEIGISIETPSNALQGLAVLESIIENGSTGLTPVTSNIPIISSGSTVSEMNTLNTPIISTTTCSTQQRSNKEVSTSEPLSKKLVSL